MLGRMLPPACSQEKIVPPLAILLRYVGEVAASWAENARQWNRCEHRLTRPHTRSFEKVSGLLFGEVTEQIEREQNIEVAIPLDVIDIGHAQPLRGFAGAIDGKTAGIEPPSFFLLFPQRADEETLCAASIEERRSAGEAFHEE